MSLRRRTFLTLPLAFGGGAILREGQTAPPKDDRLRGFIVSDAHIGSTNKDQPTPETQQEVMQHIVRRFPDLDMCIDTGDAHHAQVPGVNGKKKARENWITRIAGQSPFPFFYVPGNHELGLGRMDPELVTCDMGSLALRPYYSFTIKGIHFVSLPQLVKTILVSQETMEWLRLDLEVHRDKTVVVLAHNSVAGTTYTAGETAYRQIINSPEVLEVLDGHPNVIAWMHGHNHQYEVVDRGNRVYVSNGRLGGFNPPKSWGDFGQGHLGGIYFEVAPAHFLVRSYSATAGKFLDEIDMPHLSLLKQVKTTLDPEEPVSVCAGRGAARDGTRDVISRHYAGPATAVTAYAAQTVGLPINDNWDLALETRLHRKRAKNKLIGFRVDIDDAWKGSESGIEVLPRTDGKSVTLSVPQSSNLVGELRRASYLSCKPGGRYKLELDLDAESGGQQIDVSFQLRKLDRVVLGNWTIGSINFGKGPVSQTFEFDVPGRKVLKVDGDAQIHLLIFVKMSKLSSGLRFQNIRVLPTGKATLSPTKWRIGKQEFAIEDKVEVQSFALSNANDLQFRSEVYCHHSRQLSWLLKTDQLKWQIRNAVVTGYPDKMSLTVRDKFVPKPEIVIAPFGFPSYPFVSKLINVKSVILNGMAGKGALSIVVNEVVQEAMPAQAEVRCAQLPSNAKSLDIVRFKNGILTLGLKLGSPNRLDFSA